MADFFSATGSHAAQCRVLSCSPAEARMAIACALMGGIGGSPRIFEPDLSLELAGSHTPQRILCFAREKSMF